MILTKMPDGFKWYKKRPIAIKAIQIKEDFQVPTLEGIFSAKAGDYLIEGVSGELYSCKEDIFNRTYELSDEK